MVVDMNTPSRLRNRQTYHAGTPARMQIIALREAREQAAQARAAIAEQRATR